ncbi:MAG TPA: UTP--glucose-1-phosphate uridylyltransferase [Polyangia bacterium]|nr:UTP--glucose-1-phosphate uridylyltransferase [Polyangia bacterium]
MGKALKAVIPAAGLGTRNLPASKAIPKEMLPIVDVPSIQLIVEEAVAAGIRDIILVTGRGKHAVEDHFDVAFELEETLRRRGKLELATQMSRVSHLVNLIAVRQKEPLGLGHAVLCARDAAGDAPIAVMLPDDLLDGPRPGVAQLHEVYRRTGKGCIGLLEVEPGQERMYGIVKGQPAGPRLWQLEDLVEKPEPAQAPSRLAIVARYVLPPSIFPLLERTKPGQGGEIQLTDGLLALARSEGLFGWELEGTRYDAGDKLGWLKANLAYALKRPELAGPLREYMKKLLS